MLVLTQGVAKNMDSPADTSQAYGKKLPRYLLLPLFTMATFSHAWDYGFGVEAESQVSDNASRDDDNKIDERQDEYGFDFMLAEEAKWYLVDIDYRYRQAVFTEGSQQDRDLIEGDADFRLGQADGLLQLTAGHSRRRTLIDIAAEDTLDNSDERAISNISPVLNIRASSVDMLSVIGNYETIGYRQEFLRDSERIGTTLSWRHRLSNRSNFGLTYEDTDVEFINIEDTVYRYNNAYLSYQTVLRYFSYDINLGYNKTEQKGFEFDGPSYNMSMQYDRDGQVFGAAFINRITDTSAGNNNRDSLSVQDAADNNGNTDTGADASAVVIDQYKIITSELFYRNSSICLGCSFNLTIGRESEKYRVFLDENNIEWYSRFNATYNFNRWSRLELLSRYTDTVFEIEEQDDFSQLDHRLEWSVTSRAGLRIGLSVESRARDARSEDGNSYTENFYGINGQYIFR